MSTRYMLLQTDVPIKDSLNRPGYDVWSRTSLRVEFNDGREEDLASLQANPYNALVMDAKTVLSLVKPVHVPEGDSQRAFTPPGLIAIGASTTKWTGEGVTVAVLDGGVDRAHLAFKDKDIEPKNFISFGGTDGSTPNADHGTHTTGIVCGLPVNGIRVGVAPGVSIAFATVIGYNAKLDSEASDAEALFQAMKWAVEERKADVVLMPLGYDYVANMTRIESQGLEKDSASQEVLYQYGTLLKGLMLMRSYLESKRRNVIFVAPTGNRTHWARGAVLQAELPAAELFPVGAVASTGDKWSVADFSNAGPVLVAPGMRVLSAAPDGRWASMSGTSMAAAHVAGVAALWVQKLREEGKLHEPGALVDHLKRSATSKMLTSDKPNAVGCGLVQVPDADR